MNRRLYTAMLSFLASAAASQAASAQSAILPVADSAFAVGGYQSAAKLYGQILEREPRNLSVLVKAGYADLALKQAASAKARFEAVIATAPASGAPLAQGGLAIALARLGAHEASLARLESAAAAGYAQLHIIDNEEAFRVMRTNPRFVAARKRAESNAFPCHADSTSRSFDFWLGEWDVFLTGASRRVGASRIERVSGGCAILEHWTGLTSEVIPPSTGESLNYPDPATGEWRQVWMGSGRGQNNYEHGRYVDGAMRFSNVAKDAQGRTVTGRFTFFNLGSDRVRQFLESSLDGGQTYQPVYDFTYVRRKR